MTIQELINIDHTFNPASFITKVNNIFIKYFTSIMTDTLDEVDHFISDNVYNYGKNIINQLKSKNYRQMYDELNVKDTKVQNISINHNKYVIEVFLQARYMDYVLDLNTGNIISGTDSSRIQVDYILTFVKKFGIKEQEIAKKCPSCCAPMNVNNSGKCGYCGSIYNQEDYDWVLSDIKFC